MDRESNWVAGFNTQKLVQAPEGFGTGCIVQCVHRPELRGPTAKLLSAMRYTGIAEVEYKRDSRTGKYQLIEVNPRPWDQHRLGHACGVDLIYLAYCELAGYPIQATVPRATGQKWIAEDTFLTTVLRSIWKRDGKFGSMLRLARGKRIYGIWWARDPLPFLAYFATRYVPELVLGGIRFLGSALAQQLRHKRLEKAVASGYDGGSKKEKSHG
jgi:predicted ATP-grasp superfamily ATP-dependent carboligase